MSSARAVADQVHRRLVAGDEEQQHHRHELVVGEPFALLLGRDERGQQVVLARCLAPFGDHGLDELAHVARRFGRGHAAPLP